MFERKTAKQTEQILKTDMHRGLSGEEARNRYSREGPNQLAAGKRKSPLASFLEQLNDPLIYVLLAAAVISLLLHEISDAMIIIAVVGLNAFVGMVQEGKAQKALDSLKKLTQPMALVIRDGKEMQLEAFRLVPGDLVCLEAGCQVPADLRLTETGQLQAEESTLTGETVPVTKDAAFCLPEGAKKDPAGRPEEHGLYVHSYYSGQGKRDRGFHRHEDGNRKDRLYDGGRGRRADTFAEAAGRTGNCAQPAIAGNLRAFVRNRRDPAQECFRYAADRDFPGGGGRAGRPSGGGHPVPGAERDEDGESQHDYPPSAFCGNPGGGECGLLR